jgi:hypothetical protein
MRVAEIRGEPAKVTRPPGETGTTKDLIDCQRTVLPLLSPVPHTLATSGPAPLPYCGQSVHRLSTPVLRPSLSVVEVAYSRRLRRSRLALLDDEPALGQDPSLVCRGFSLQVQKRIEVLPNGSKPGIDHGDSTN